MKDQNADVSLQNLAYRPGNSEFFAKLPKVHLHTHLLGMVRADTVFDLANKYRLDLEVDHPASFYTYYDFQGFLNITHKIAKVMRSEEDFSRVMYEAIADDYHNSRVLHSEISIQTPTHLLYGVPRDVIYKGFADGVRRAGHEFGVSVGLIDGLNRSLPAYYSLDFVRSIIAEKPDFVIGIGLEDFETAGPPELFIDAFRLAKSAGLRLTAHAGEHGPAANVVTSLAALNCERIDHGYQVVSDHSIIARVADGVHFTVCPTVSTRQGWNRPDGHVIKKMHDAGLWISINADDGAVVRSSLAKEYQLAAAHIGLDPEQMARMSMRSIDAAWLSDQEKEALRVRFKEEFGQLEELKSVHFN